MIDLLKDVIGLAAETTDYDLYLVIISAIAICWVVKTVISGLYSAVLHIFK